MLTIRCSSEKAKSPNVFYTLLVGQKYAVGRKGGDISFPDDQSVSRNHAEIVVEHPLANVSDPLLIPTVVVTDLGSKFGTFTNEGIERRAQLSMREPVNLSPGDKFRFGLQWNEYKIEYIPLVVTSSTLKEQLKLKHVIMTLGGHMVMEWCDKCDYVVMDLLTLTVKAVCAILSAKHIVTPAFFNDLFECVKTKKGHPNPANFLPACGEKTLTDTRLSLKPDVRRTQLFEGKTFLFAHQKHMKKVGDAIKCGGGTCALIGSASRRNLTSEEFIIMKPTQEYIFTDQQTQQAVEIYTKANKRFIQDSEIGLAAVYISIEKYCNPSHFFPDNVFPKLGSQTQQSPSGGNSDVVLAPETPEIPTQISVSSQSRNVVEESEPLVKQEPLTETEKDPCGSKSGSKASKRNLNGNEQDIADVSSSKKRSADESLVRSGSGSKRLRSGMVVESHKTLSTLFSFFGDDEDETVAESVIALDSQSQMRRNDCEAIAETMDMVPESCPASPDIVPSSLDVIADSPDIQNTSSDSDIQEVETEDSMNFRKPAQPEPRRVTRFRGVIELSEIEAEPSNCSKRKIRSSEESAGDSPQASKKPKTKKMGSTSTSDNDELVDQAEKECRKLKITPIKIETSANESRIHPCNVSILIRPILMTTKVQPKIEVVNGKNVKNFKTFKKVLTLAQQRNNENSERRSGNTLSSQKLTFEVFTYSLGPLSISSFGPASSRLDETESIASTKASTDYFAKASSSAQTKSSRRKKEQTVHASWEAASAKANQLNLSKQPPADAPKLFLPTFEDEGSREDDIWGF